MSSASRSASSARERGGGHAHRRAARRRAGRAPPARLPSRAAAARRRRRLRRATAIHTFSPDAPRAATPRSASSASRRVAPLGVDRARRARCRAARRRRPTAPTHEALEDVADPARARTAGGPGRARSCARRPRATASRRSGPSALATERVAAQRSRPGATVCRSLPATGPRWSSSTTSTSGWLLEHGAQLAARARRRARRRSGSGRAVSDDARSAPRVQRRLRALAGSSPRSSTAHRLEREPAGRAAGRTAPRSRGSRRRRDRRGAGAPASTRSIASSAPLTTHSALGWDPVGAQLRARHAEQLGQVGRLAVEPGAPARCRAGRALEIGQQRRVGVAPREVARSRRHRQRRAPARRADRRPLPMRVPRRGSVITTPRRRSSATAAATVTGLSPTSAASRRTDGSRCAGAQRPRRRRRLRSPATSSAALAAVIRYCFRSDTSAVLLQIRRNGQRVAARRECRHSGPGAPAPQARTWQPRARGDRRDPRRGRSIAHLGIADDGRSADRDRHAARPRAATSSTATARPRAAPCARSPRARRYV